MSEQWEDSLKELSEARERATEKHPELINEHGQFWPIYREEDTPDGLDHQDAVNAVIEALNQEGIHAWHGDAVGIVADLLNTQYQRAQACQQEWDVLREIAVRAWSLEMLLDALGARKSLRDAGPDLDSLSASLDSVRDSLDSWQAALKKAGKK